MIEWPPEPPVDFVGPAILGLDPSMNSMGLAVARPCEQIDSFIQCSGVFRQRSEHADELRIEMIADVIRRTVDMWPIERIIVECPTSLYVPRGRSIDALKFLLVLGAIQAAAGYMNVKVNTVTVRDWKGKGKAEKWHSRELAFALMGRTAKYDDELEACLLALYACKPTEMVVAFHLMRLGASAEKAIETFGKDVKFGPQEVNKLEALGRMIRLRASGKKMK